MSFAQVLEELPRFTASQRQELLRNVLELDEQGLPPEELVMVDERLVSTLQNKRNNYLGDHESSMHPNYSLSPKKPSLTN